jgi:hypothetical protein
MNITDVIPALEQAAGVLADLAVTSVELSTAAESARASVSALDDAIASHPELKAEIFNRIAPSAASPGTYRLRPHSISEAIDNLLAHERDGQVILARRAVAAWLAAALDAKGREVEKTEAAIAAARTPFKAQARRVADLAKAFATYPALASRIVSLFRSDVLVARFGSNAYSRVPVLGSHVSFVRTFRLPRILATPERLTATRLLGYWPPKYSDFSGLELAYYHDDERDGIAGPVYELCQKSIISDADVDRVVATAQALLVSEYKKTSAAIRELLVLDDSVTAADCAARYPDGAPILDPSMFPEHWQIGVMNKTFNGYPRVALPALDGMARAPE